MIISAPGDLDGDTITTLAAGGTVTLADGLLDAVAAARARMQRALDAATGPVYGVNTGMGRMVGHHLSAEEQQRHQHHLLAGRAVGGPPWLPVRDVRALLLVRLRTLLAPETAASPDAVAFLAARIDDGFLPCVPATGLGSAGEILALAHAFGTLVGLGTVLATADGAPSPDRDPTALSGPPLPATAPQEPAAAALAARGAHPYRLRPKEGASFLQGCPLAITHALLRAAEARRALAVAAECAAVTVEALGAPRAIYSPALAGPDTVLAGVLADLAARTAEGYHADVVQAPVSVRVAPQALAHAHRVTAELAEAADRTLAAPTDSPSLLGERFVSTGGFHAAALGLRLDAVTAALAHLGELSTQRMHRLVDERFTGLPAQLAANPGANAGLSPLHKRAVGELHALRRLTTPATLGSLDTSGGQEDVQAFAPAAGEGLRAAIGHLLTISACELVAGHHAHLLRATPSTPALEATHRLVDRFVPLSEQDRPLGPGVDALTAALGTEPLPWKSAQLPR